MAYTSQIPVTAAAQTAIVANSYCRNIRVTENRGISGWATVDFNVYKPIANVTPVRIQAGAQYTFNAPDSQYKPGDIAGYVEFVSTRTSTFDQDEDNK